jgi:hypothetical protein
MGSIEARSAHRNLRMNILNVRSDVHPVAGLYFPDRDGADA